jgi:dihydrofolate reductase
MREVVMWDVMTLDGFFEGPQSGDIGWFESVWGEELEKFSLDQAKEIDTLLFGRVTYEGMATYWQAATGDIADFMNSVPKVVFSRTLREATWHNSRLVSTEAADEVARLKQQPGKGLFIFGSANLASSLLNTHLIDEIRLCLAPIVLGTGNPLFKPGTQRQDFSLTDARTLKSDAVILRYRRREGDKS